MPTTISVPEEIADELYERKQRGESYGDVIERLLEQDRTREDAQAGESQPEDTRREVPEPTPGASHSADQEQSAPETFADIVDAVAEDTLPGSGAKLEDRREALHAVVEYLRQEGTARPSDFQEDVYPHNQAWYEDGKDPSRSWWKNAMYPALAELAERTDEIARADQSGEWRWRGDA